MSLASSTTRRTPRPSIELEVLETEWLNPHLVRVGLGGDGFSRFEDRPETDKYVKLLFAASDPEPRQVTRTYTIRRVVPAEQRLEIDFVVHGDEGLAGPWAAAARAGDRIALMGPGGGYAPRPDAEWHLFAGDLSAVPAIAASLEALPDDASGVVLIEIDAADAPVPLTAPRGVEVRWILDPAHDPQRLAEEVRSLDWPSGEIQVFAHGEREAMKALRRILFTERELERGQVSLSGYWARGRTEDRFQAEKRESIGKIFPEG
ncbi:siderophore-interacting protein [Leucobacter weissii]|uniref:Siderophore-interacting protein n=1 Tax=Leucobacter weissii TaxID=1983706 RepID=A0A939MKT9_9MICO|nr:siderophore-interacting protein [Leucobacter weissii]MBO1902819.1 siderophore-interacting protein [Leucobacter weissii]